MKFKEFKEELSRQITINSKYFKNYELKLLYSFLETISKQDFEEIK